MHNSVLQKVAYVIVRQQAAFQNSFKCSENANKPVNFTDFPTRLFLLPVVPDVLHIVVIFHDVDELFHQGHMVGVIQGLVVLGNHFDLSGNEGVLGEIGRAHV